MNEQTNKNYTPYTFQMKRRTNKTSKVIDLKKTQSRAANNRNFIYHLHTFRSIQSMIILHFASFAFAFFSIFTHKGEEKKIQSTVFFPFKSHRLVMEGTQLMALKICCQNICDFEPKKKAIQ